MKNKTINIGAVSIVAKGLKELKDSIVFVGGSIIRVCLFSQVCELSIAPTFKSGIELKVE